MIILNHQLPTVGQKGCYIIFPSCDPLCELLQQYRPE